MFAVILIIVFHVITGICGPLWEHKHIRKFHVVRCKLHHWPDEGDIDHGCVHYLFLLKKEEKLLQAQDPLSDMNMQLFV